MAENENVEAQEPLNSTSPEPESSPSEMLKPWLKTLGKEFYRNETLGKFDSLKDAMNSLLQRPERKDVPETYSIREGTEEIFRSAGLTKSEAESIDGFYSKLIPEKKPDLKEYFKDSYDETMKFYKSGIEGISKDLSDDISKSGLDLDPTFVRIMARVGKEVGTGSFIPEKNEPETMKDPFFEMVKKAHNI